MSDRRLPQHVIDQAIAAARRSAPRETCGLLLGRAESLHGAMALRNVASGASAFEFDPLEMARTERAARGKGLAILGYFHSHPHAASMGDLRPSRADRAGICWPGFGPRLSLIVSPDGAWALYEIGRDRWARIRSSPLSTAEARGACGSVR